MSSLDNMQQRIAKYRDARDWKQFHKPKDLALSLVLEAAEVIEHFQWKDEAEVTEYLKNHTDDVADELIDVLYWVLLMANDLNIDLNTAFDRKMAQNEAKYPIEKAKGNHKKYTELA